MRRPRFSVADRWALPKAEPYVAIPIIVLRLAAKLGLDPSLTLVLIVLIDRWRPEDGNSFEMSLAELQPLTGLSRSRLQEIVQDLADHPTGALIGYFVGGKGRRGSFDLTPLLAQVKRFRSFPETVRPSGHQVSGLGDQVSGTPDGSVRFGAKSVRSPASEVAAHSPEKQPETRRAATSPAVEAPAVAAQGKRTAAEIHAILAPLIAEEQSRTQHGGIA